MCTVHDSNRTYKTHKPLFIRGVLYNILAGSKECLPVCTLSYNICVTYYYVYNIMCT